MSWFDSIRGFFAGTRGAAVGRPGNDAPIAPRWIVADPSADVLALVEEATRAGVDLRGCELVGAARERRRVAIARRSHERGHTFVFVDLYVVHDGVWTKGPSLGTGVDAEADAAELARFAAERMAERLRYPTRSPSYVPVAERRAASRKKASRPFELARITDRFTPSLAREVDEVEGMLGFTLPAGYREYVTTFGDAEIDTLVRVLPPRELLARSAEERVRQEAFDPYPDDAVLDLEDRLACVCIATTVQGDVVLVHPADARRIFVLPRHHSRILEVGPSLDDAFRRLCSRPLVQPGPRPPLVLPTAGGVSCSAFATEDAADRGADSLVKTLVGWFPSGGSVVEWEDEDGEHVELRSPAWETKVCVSRIDDAVTVHGLAFGPDAGDRVSRLGRVLAELGFEIITR